MLINLLKSEPELLMCASLIEHNSGDNVLAKSLALLLGEETDPLPEMKGLNVISFEWASGRL